MVVRLGESRSAPGQCKFAEKDSRKGIFLLLLSPMNEEKKPCHLCKIVRIAFFLAIGFLFGFIVGVLMK